MTELKLNETRSIRRRSDYWLACEAFSSSLSCWNQCSHQSQSEGEGSGLDVERLMTDALPVSWLPRQHRVQLPRDERVWDHQAEEEGLPGLPLPEVSAGRDDAGRYDETRFGPWRVRTVLVPVSLTGRAQKPTLITGFIHQSSNEQSKD